MKPTWTRALLRSLLSTAIFVFLFGAYQAWQGQSEPVGSLGIVAVVWFSASLVLERFVYPLFEPER